MLAYVWRGTRDAETSASWPASAPAPYRASGLVVCWACSVAWRWKSSTQP